MKIQNSSIQLASQHSAVKRFEMRESVRIWLGDQRTEARSEHPARRASVADIVELSDAGKISRTDTDDEDFAPTPELRMLKMMIERMLGIKIKLSSLKLSDEDTEKLEEVTKEPAEPEGEHSQGFGIEYDRHESYYESEKLNFSASGLIRTADGEAISFNIHLSLEREFVIENNISARFGDAARLHDPLIINFGGNSADLTSAKFSFDLDVDGEEDRISAPGANSGFLAIDHNNDSRINDGSELFGPQTGKGFDELARYDSDGNGWIDESDPVYDKLLVWSKDVGGNDILASLRDRKVGAIYLGNRRTKFDLNNGQNQMQGQLNSSGVYVSENGSVGTIQQVDMTM